MTIVRPVDAAMLAQRAEKKAIRKLWLERASFHAQQTPNVQDTLYFTLPGVDASEIEMLVNAQLLKATETGAIDSAYSHRVVGIEQNAFVHTQILTKYPGFKLIRSSLNDFLRGTTNLRYPEAGRARYCKAKVVNLDLNAAWSPANNEIPTLTLIKKLSVIHSSSPTVDWSLLLTLHGECPWSGEVATFMSASIRNISNRLGEYAVELEQWLGHELYQAIQNNSLQDYSVLDRVVQQRMLMWLVPAMIAEKCAPEGWKIEVQHNLRYGQHPNAPMVSWVMNFSESGLHFAADTHYTECLVKILNNPRVILPTGVIEADVTSDVGAYARLYFAA